MKDPSQGYIIYTCKQFVKPPHLCGTRVFAFTHKKKLCFHLRWWTTYQVSQNVLCHAVKIELPLSWKTDFPLTQGEIYILIQFEKKMLQSVSMHEGYLLVYIRDIIKEKI